MPGLTRGFTLMELLICSALGLSLYAAVISFTLKLMNSHHHLTERLQLEQELQAVLSAMANQLRRAGYHGTLHSLRSPDESPPANLFAEAFSLSAYPGELQSSCVLFSYDRNHNGLIDTQTPSEQLGFRLRDQSVELRFGGNLCEQSGWHDFTDNRYIRVHSLIFEHQSISPDQGSVLTVRLTAALTARPQVRRTASQSVRLRNVVR